MKDATCDKVKFGVNKGRSVFLLKRKERVIDANKLLHLLFFPVKLKQGKIKREKLHIVIQAHRQKSNLPAL